MIDLPAFYKRLTGQLLGPSDVLNSAFNLSFNMMLNLVNKEGLDPSVLTKKSFRQHQNERNLVRAVSDFVLIPSQPKLKNDLAALQKRRSEAVIPNEKAIVEYYETKKQLNGLKREVRNISNQPIYALTFLNPGT